jgi:hypothetical protein
MLLSGLLLYPVRPQYRYAAKLLGFSPAAVPGQPLILRNHKDVIAAMDFFVIPTVGFRLLYIWFIIDHGRRRIIHFNVTTNPSEQWVM